MVLALLLVTGAGCENAECEVEELIEQDIEGLNPIECGVYDIGFSEEAPELEEAHACVRQAIDSGVHFYVLWRDAGFEGSTTHGYVSRDLLGAFVVLEYTRWPDVGGSYTTRRSICTGLEPREDCAGVMLNWDLCFDCVERSTEVLSEE